MKIAFSTLACSDFSWTDIYTMAKDLGFDGIELRGMGYDMGANPEFATCKKNFFKSSKENT